MPQSGYEGWAIPRAARNPAAALDFMSYMTSAQTAALLLTHGMLPAHHLDARAARVAAPFQQEYLDALNGATPGVYLDAAPIPNINATMEANIQLLLQGYETPDFLPRSLQQVYASRGAKATSTRTDGEF
jgi:ABC-type glycerol-3-phosphate transport system substrate-binding protein